MSRFTDDAARNPHQYAPNYYRDRIGHRDAFSNQTAADNREWRYYLVDERWGHRVSLPVVVNYYGTPLTIDRVDRDGASGPHEDPELRAVGARRTVIAEFYGYRIRATLAE